MTPKELLRSHLATGEPLTADELAEVVAAGLTEWDAWEDRGGGLWWHREAWPSGE